MEREFDVELYEGEDGWWVVECPALPGCVSQGRTEAEALEMIKDAIRVCLEARHELGWPEKILRRTVMVPAHSGHSSPKLCAPPTPHKAAPEPISEALEVDPVSGHCINTWSGEEPHPWKLYCGPAKEALKLLSDSSVDCVITSPPYFWLRDYKVKGQIGLEETVNGYVVALTDVFLEVFRVLKPEGTLFLNIGDTFYSGKGKSHGQDKKSSKRRFGLRAVDKSGGLGIGLQRKSIIGIPWRVAIQMCQHRWVLRSPIIWHRLKSLPEVVHDRPSRGYEYVFFFVKSRRYYFNKNHLPNGGNAEDVWSIPARAKLNGAKETAPFPEELVEQCLAVGCPDGGVVLDPFCGSGTTLRVALTKGHPAIGIELNESFCSHILTDITKLAT